MAGWSSFTKLTMGMGSRIL